MHRSERHHHRRKTFVTGRDTDDSFPRRMRSNQPPIDRRGIVPIGQRIHHPVGTLSTPVTWVTNKSRKRYSAQRRDRLRDLFHEQAHFKMSRVIPEGDRFPVGLSDPSLRTENQIIPPRNLVSIPPHPYILRPSEKMATGMRSKLFRSERQHPGRPGCLCPQRVNRVVT